MTRSKWHNRHYLQRKVEGRCVHCQAGLQETDGVSCVECAEQQHAWKRTPNGRRSRRKTQAKFRKKRVAEGGCIQCLEPAMPGKLMCRRHREAATIAQRLWRARKAQGVIVLATAAIERERRNARKPAAPTYVPLDERLESPRVRLLRTLEHHDWLRSYEVFEAANIPTYVCAEHNNAQQLLSRLCRSGQLEKRGTTGSFEYRITDSGRAELAKVRRVA